MPRELPISQSLVEYWGIIEALATMLTQFGQKARVAVAPVLPNVARGNRPDLREDEEVERSSVGGLQTFTDVDVVSDVEADDVVGGAVEAGFGADDDDGQSQRQEDLAEHPSDDPGQELWVWEAKHGDSRMPGRP